MGARRSPVRVAGLIALAACATALVGCASASPRSVTDGGTSVPATTAAATSPHSTADTATSFESPSTMGAAGPVTDATATSEPASDGSTTLPPGGTPGLDDYNGDGEPDPTCGTEEFGADLVLRIPCQISTANEPENGTVLVGDSLYRLPGTDFDEFNDISATAIQARDAAGGKVVIIFFNSDALFALNSASLGGDATTASLNATVLVVQHHFPDASIQVRGHTDALGTVAGNEKLSVQRALAVKDYLGTHGLDGSRITAVGFGSNAPLAQEQNADGSDNAAGRAFNRRVEIVVRAG